MKTMSYFTSIVSKEGKYGFAIMKKDANGHVSLEKMPAQLWDTLQEAKENASNFMRQFSSNLNKALDPNVKTKSHYGFRNLHSVK